MWFLRPFLLLGALAVMLGIASVWLHPRLPGWQEGQVQAGALTPTMLRSLNGPVLWVDAREAADYAAGHIPGAVHVSESDWEAGLAAFFGAWDPAQIVVVYCGGAACQASRAVRDRLLRDFPDASVFYLAGGYAVWQEAIAQ
jgi:rhodanese-related sulfurtransferase